MKLFSREIYVNVLTRISRKSLFTFNLKEIQMMHICPRNEPRNKKYWDLLYCRLTIIKKKESCFILDFPRYLLKNINIVKVVPVPFCSKSKRPTPRICAINTDQLLGNWKTQRQKKIKRALNWRKQMKKRKTNWKRNWKRQRKRWRNIRKRKTN